VLGNSRLVFGRGTFLFHDGLAWMAQITMFVILGLLSYPSQLLKIGWQALAISAVLILVARPLAVIPILLPLRFNVRELALVSWVGLRGAVPIILATFPLIYGLPSGPLLFDVVFFVVLVSAVIQGASISRVARWLKLELPPKPAPPVSLEITSLFDVNADIVEYAVTEKSHAAGRHLNELAFPNHAVVAMIARQDTLIPPRGSTQILAGDYVFVVLRRDTRPVVDQVFGASGETFPPEALDLRGSTTVQELATVHGITLERDGAATLEEVLTQELGRSPQQGDVVQLNGVALCAREVIDGRTTSASVRRIPFAG